MNVSTSELCDRYGQSEHLQIADPLFKSFGGVPRFSGQVTTLKVFEDDVLLRSVLGERVEDRVLVIDGGGSHRCSLLGADLARLAAANGWAGIIVYGCIRDSRAMAETPLGVLALHAHPRPSHQRGGGDRDVLITFAGVNFRIGSHVYVDEDGIVVSDARLN